MGILRGRTARSRGSRCSKAGREGGSDTPKGAAGNGSLDGGDGAADFSIILTGTIALQATDFMLQE
jgi:hypothetical protein